MINRKLWLNLGSGILQIPSNDEVEVFNIDWADDLQYNDHMIRHDLREGLPSFIQADSVDFINMSQFFEHLNLYDEEKLLKECYNVMKKGAEMRISVPDAGMLIDRMYKEDMDEFAGVQPVIYSQYNSPAIKCALLIFGSLDKHGDSGHKMMWMFSGLKEILEKHGFTEVTRKRHNPFLDASVAENHEVIAVCKKP